MNQPCFSSLNELRKLGEIVFSARLLFPYFWMIQLQGQIDPTNLILRSILSPWIKGLFSIKIKLSPIYKSEKLQQSFLFSSFPFLFEVACSKKISSKFSKKFCFNGFSKNEHGLIYETFISHSLSFV